MAEVAPASRLTSRGAAVLLVVSWAVFFSGALLHFDRVPYYRDHLVTFVPLRDYLRERLLSGELPQWFPYEGLGVPVIGQIATGTFHPLNLLATPLPAPQGEKWVVLIAYLLSLIGAYRAARATGVGRGAAVLGAWAFSFGGYSLGVSSIMNYVLSFPALAWVVWASIRVAEKQRLRDGALLALCASLVFLAGDALGFAACAGIGAIAFSARPSRRGALLFLLAGVWAAALVGIELLPSTALSADAVRNVGHPSPSLPFSWATHPLRLLELFLPGFIPDPQRARMLGELLGGGTSTFLTTVYFGVVTFAALTSALCPALPRAGKVALAAAVLALLLALGGHTGLLGAAQAVVPVLEKFRYPERYLAFFWVALLWVVPFGFQRALTHPPWRFWVGAGLAAAVNLALAAPFAAHRVADPQLAEALAMAWRPAGLLGAALALAAAAALVVRTPALRTALLGALLFADLYRGNAAHLPLVPARDFAPSPFAAAVQRTAADGAPPVRVSSEVQRQWPSGVSLPGREDWVASTLARLRPSCSELSRVQTLGSNLGGMQRRHVLVFGVADSRASSVAGYFNGCFAVRDDDGSAPAEAARAPEVSMVLEPRACWPRAFLAEAVPSTMEEALRAPLSLERRRVSWEGGPALDSSEGTLRWVAYAPERRVLEVDVPRPTALVESDDFVPGWTASLDGAAVPIHPAMVTALGVEVPAGKHRVELVFRTPRLVPGAALSLIGLIGLIACAAAVVRKRRAPVSTS